MAMPDTAQDSGPAAPPNARRRIDRVIAADFLTDVGERPLTEVRGMRDDCRLEEARVSFARRLLQARLDIVRAEMARRADGGKGDLLQSLPDILADETMPTTLGDARSVPFYEPFGDDERARRNSDDLMGDPSLGQLPDLDDAELVALVDSLASEERGVSEIRRRLLEHLDALQGELIRRYTSGGVDTEGILGGDR